MKKLIKKLFKGSAFEQAQGLYGPPPSFNDDPEKSESFRPEENKNVCVYGPPEWFRDKNKDPEEEPDES